MKTMIVAVVIMMLSGCGMKLTRTPEQVYKDETAQLKAIKEHQMLQLEIIKINMAIAQMQTAAQRQPSRQKVTIPGTEIEGEFIPADQMPPK